MCTSVKKAKLKINNSKKSFTKIKFFIYIKMIVGLLLDNDKIIDIIAVFQFFLCFLFHEDFITKYK